MNEKLHARVVAVPWHASQIRKNQKFNVVCSESRLKFGIERSK